MDCNDTHTEVASAVVHVSPSATRTEVSSAFRRLVRKLHPDVNSSTQATRLLQAVRDAHAVLSDDALRKQYDTRGYAALEERYSKYAFAGKDKHVSPMEENGRDVMTVVWLDVVEAALGSERVLNVKVRRTCPSCSGIASHTMVNCTCMLCKGTGKMLRSSPVGQGKLKVAGLCPLCGGEGIQNQQWCQTCGGLGQARIHKRMRIRVPPGVDHRSVMRLKGSGDVGKHGGRAGDVFVSFVIKPRPDIHRKGRDLFSKLNVAYLDAIMGAQYKVETIHGTAWLTIPPGTQHGSSLRLEGKGVHPDTDADASKEDQPFVAAGAHFFEVAIKVPIEVNEVETELLNRLRLLQNMAPPSP